MRIIHRVKYHLGLTKHKYKIGDKVIFVNDFGVCWGVKTITGLDERSGRPTYHYEPTDTPWFSTNEENLILASRSDLRASQEELQVKYGFMPTDWFGCY